MRKYDETYYYHKHARRWRRLRNDWSTILAMNIYKSWDSPILMPESLVEDSSFSYALECLLYGDRENGNAFLNRTIEVADRILAENRCLWEQTLATTGYPRNHAIIQRDRAYAKWLLGGDFDRDVMKSCARQLVEWCLTKANDHEHFTDAFTMNYYVQGIRAAIIACDLDLAGELVRTKQPLLGLHGHQRDLWRKLIDMYPDLTDEFDGEFETFFDLVRDPDFQERVGKARNFIIRDILALETGIIREMYIINASPHRNPDPENVLAAVAR